MFLILDAYWHCYFRTLHNVHTVLISLHFSRNRHLDKCIEVFTAIWECRTISPSHVQTDKMFQIPIEQQITKNITILIQGGSTRQILLYSTKTTLYSCQGPQDSQRISQKCYDCRAIRAGWRDSPRNKWQMLGYTLPVSIYTRTNIS